MNRLKKPAMRPIGLLIVFCQASMCLLTGAVAHGQQTPPGLKAETNLVLVRLVVRDRQGKPITGLKKEDFKLYDQGKEQTIVQFDEIYESATPQQLATPLSNESKTNSGWTGPAPSIPRLVAFYFDTLNATQANIMQARDAADKFITSSLQPSDNLAIFSSDKLLIGFTSDSAKIHEALTQLNGSIHSKQTARRCPDISEYQAGELLRTDDYFHDPAWQLAGDEYKQCTGRDTDLKSPPDINLIRATAQAIVGEAQAKTRANLQQIEQVTKYVSHLSGQRTILLVSPGFLTSEDQYQLDRIIDEALHTQIVIDALDPKGLAILMREQDSSRRPMANTERSFNSAYTLDSAQSVESGNVLTELTQGTGGRIINNDNDLAAGFASLVAQPDEYTLAFSPKDLKHDGKFHELKVIFANKPKGVIISARKGYFANEEHAAGPTRSPEPTNSAATETAVITPLPSASMQPSLQFPQMDDFLRQAILATTDSTDLPIDVDLKPQNNTANSNEISFLIHLDARALPFRKDGDHSLDTVTFAAAVFDASDKVGVIKQRSAQLNLTPDQLTQLNDNGINLTFTFPREAGAHRIRAAVIEAEQHKIGSLSKDIAIQ